MHDARTQVYVSVMLLTDVWEHMYRYAGYGYGDTVRSHMESTILMEIVLDHGSFPHGFISPSCHVFFQCYLCHWFTWLLMSTTMSLRHISGMRYIDRTVDGRKHRSIKGLA